MGFSYITKYNSPNYGYPMGTRGQNNVTRIVVHHWGNDGQKFQNVVNWLCNKNAGVSAHFVVQDGKCAALVDWRAAAWHAGKKAVNLSSIGIECRPECTKGDIDTLAQVIAMVWKHYKRKLPVVGHKDIVATACPGRYYPKLREITKLAEKYYNGEKTEPITLPSTQPSSKSFKVKVSISDLFIRAGAGTNTAKRGFIKKGVYTITETKINGGYEWGKLKSGAGWIALNFTTRV